MSIRMFSLAAALSVLMIACSSDGSDGALDPTVNSLIIDQKGDALSIDVGESLRLTATVDTSNGAGSGVTWSSSTPSVAAVSAAGVVEAVAPGDAEIAAVSSYDPAVRDSVTISVESSAGVGSVVWTRQTGTADWDVPAGMSIDSNGRLIVARSRFVHGGGRGTGGTEFAGSYTDRYDREGKHIPGGMFAASRQVTDVAVNGDHQIYVGSNRSRGFVLNLLPAEFGWSHDIGYLSLALDVAVDASGDILVVGLDDSDSGLRYGFVRKVGSDGSLIWNREIGLGWEAANYVSVDDAGAVFVVGTTYIDFAGPYAGGADVYIQKYSTSGDLIWRRQLGTPAEDYPGGLAVDASGNAVIVATSAARLNGASNGGTDVILRKYGPDGAVRWTREFGTTEDDTAHDVATGRTGIVYVTGTTHGTFAGPSAGGADAYIRTFRPDGSEGVVRQFGTDQADAGHNLALDDSGQVHVTGTTDGSLGSTNLGETDVFVRKFGN